MPRRAENRLRRLRIRHDVVLQRRRLTSEIAAEDTAAHCDEVDFSNDVRSFAHQIRGVGKRTDREKRHRNIRLAHNLRNHRNGRTREVECSGNSVIAEPFALAAAFFDSRLAEPDRNGGEPGGLHEFRAECGAVERIARLRGDSLQLHRIRPEKHSEGPGVIDVSADVRIDNKRFSLHDLNPHQFQTSGRLPWFGLLNK